MMMKSLRIRIAGLVTLLVAGSLVIGVGAAIGIQSLQRDVGVALRGYRQLRQVYEVGFHVAAAREALRDDRPAAALSAVQTASVKLETAGGKPIGETDSGAWFDEPQRKQCVAALHEAADDLRHARDVQRTSGSESAATSSASTLLDNVLAHFASISAEVRQTVAAQEAAVERDRRTAFLHVIVFSLAVIAAGFVIGVRLYRSVVRPLDALAHGVRRFARTRFDQPLSTAGDREFASLASDFNTMAGELATLYRDLEERVQLKSRQLVQSERLASVGYLAAGVAHEINNPLGIIAGYGERSQQLLARGWDESTAQSVNRAIGVICDQAFRCKQITDHLLRLARPGEQAAKRISVAQIATDVIMPLGGLPRFADRRITLAADEPESLDVIANEGELRQVILNLVINALEAVSPGVGEVRVSITRDATNVILTVADNGRGIDADSLTRIFEPFYTDKRGSDDGDHAAESPDKNRGTGLGLSVAHAIVAEHCGRIEAHSAGPGAGSRFIVHLPAADQGAYASDR